MVSYKAQLEAYRIKMVEKYRGLARRALELVFPDESLLTEGQFAQVIAMINKESAFGLFQTKIASQLDAVQGKENGPAATAWNAAFSKYVEFLGGYSAGEALRPEDEAAIKSMFEEVKTWVANRVKNYPIDLNAIYPKFTLTVTTGGTAETRTASGNISFGIGTRRSKMEFYSLLLHELRHAVKSAYRAAAANKSLVTTDMGTAVEGSGVAAETLLLEPFMREKLGDDLAYVLSALNYGIRDARFTGTTDATLQKYFRTGCSGANDPDTIEFTKRIAEGYGLTGELADTAAKRAHVGTQYFQYIFSGEQVVNDIAYLQAEIDPNSKSIDPFVLFACGLNNPRREPSYIGKLKACLQH